MLSLEQGGRPADPGGSYAVVSQSTSYGTPPGEGANFREISEERREMGSAVERQLISFLVKD